MRRWIPFFLLVFLTSCNARADPAPPGDAGVEARRRTDEGGQGGFTRLRYVTSEIFARDSVPDRREHPTPEFGHDAPQKRWRDHSREWMVRWVLAPITALFLVFLVLGIRRGRRSRGLWLAVLVSAGLGAVVIQPLFEDLSGRILYENEKFTDPLDSVALVAAIADSLPRLSDVTERFSYPEGTTWLLTGPSWLGYLVPAGIAALSDPVVGHNLGIGLAVALLALCSWALARSLGAGPFAALFAAGGSALAPIFLDELALMSLDRSTLFLTPLFFLCLHKAANERTWYWPLAAGVTLAAVFYGQVYYGIYLAAACPLLVIPRLVGPGFRGRVARMLMVGGVAAALLAPGLWILQIGAADTPDAMPTNSLRESADDLLRPFDFEEARGRMEELSSRCEHFPMAEPEERLLAAVAQSLALQYLISPSFLLADGSIYWFLVVLSILLALAARRAAVIVAATDALILIIFAMGPFLRIGPEITSVPLPYYLDFLYVPGFEQLKNVGRYALLAATISSIPLALGLEGAFRRISERPLPCWRWLEIPVVALCVFGTVSLVWSPVMTRFSLPDAHTFPLPESLQAIEPGPALVLPIKIPLDNRISIHALQAGLSLVNESPFGMPEKALLPMWIESNRILNEIAFASGSDRARRRIQAGDRVHHLESLRDHGLRYVVVYRELLPGPDIISDTEQVLDTWFERRADDGKVAVWELPGAPD